MTRRKTRTPHPSVGPGIWGEWERREGRQVWWVLKEVRETLPILTSGTVIGPNLGNEVIYFMETTIFGLPLTPR